MTAKLGADVIAKLINIAEKQVGGSFTEAEREPVSRYFEAVAGIPDCFVGIDLEYFRELEQEFGRENTVG